VWDCGIETAMAGGAWQTFAHEKVLEILNSRLSGLQEEEARHV